MPHPHDLGSPGYGHVENRPYGLLGATHKV